MLNYYLLSIIVAGVVLCATIALLVRVLYLQFGMKGHFIRKAAKALAISKSEVKLRFQLVMNEAQAMCRANGAQMRFSPYYPSAKVNDFGIVTSYKKMRLITYAPMWIYLIATKSLLWHIAFLQSVGHEFAHRKDAAKGKGFYRRSKEEKRFYYWLREVRCDFEGVRMVLDYFDSKHWSRKTVVSAVKKKSGKYIALSKKGDKATMSHPSWALRVALLKQHEEFNEEVVAAVAKAAGCTNEAYIEAMQKATIKREVIKF